MITAKSAGIDPICSRFSPSSGKLSNSNESIDVRGSSGNAARNISKAASRSAPGSSRTNNACSIASALRRRTPSIVSVAPRPSDSLMGESPVPTIRMRVDVSSPGSSQVPACPTTSTLSPTRSPSAASVRGPSMISSAAEGLRPLMTDGPSRADPSNAMNPPTLRCSGPSCRSRAVGKRRPDHSHRDVGGTTRDERITRTRPGGDGGHRARVLNLRVHEHEVPVPADQARRRAQMRQARTEGQRADDRDDRDGQSREAARDGDRCSSATPLERKARAGDRGGREAATGGDTREGRTFHRHIPITLHRQAPGRRRGDHHHEQHGDERADSRARKHRRRCQARVRRVARYRSA